MRFDIFTVRQWRDCYTLEVKVARPRNAPRYKYTKTDKERLLSASKKNLELIGKEFSTLEAVMEEIKHLQFPTE